MGNIFSKLFRSFADATRRISLSEGIINLSISQNYPSPPKTVTITVPIARDDLDIARTKAPGRAARDCVEAITSVVG